MVEIAKLGIIGAGLMGNGIAHVAALSGIPVVLMDVQQQALDRALATMAKNMDRQVSKGSISGADRDTALGRIVTATDNSAFADCDMVIEAATENEEIKKKIFAALCPVLKPDAFLASNTSSIPITRLATSTDRPGRFLGMHFFNPVPVMKLVEVIRGLATEDAATGALFHFLIQEENRHRDLMEELYQHVNRPNNWVESAEFGVREEY